MKKVYTTRPKKNVYELENSNYMLELEDDVTGENGVFDPGADTVGLSIEGIGSPISRCRYISSRSSRLLASRLTMSAMIWRMEPWKFCLLRYLATVWK